MRITNNMMVNCLRRNLNTNMLEMDKWQRQLSSGRKLNRPSDDPAGLVKSLRLRTNMNENEQYLENIGEALNYMETTDAALNNINQILQRVRELTVKAANGTNDTDAHKAIAVEIRELNDQLKMIANTTYGTKHVFAGRNVTEQPCQGDEWKGNDENIELEIGIGVTMAINLTNQSMKDFFFNKENDSDSTKAADLTLSHGIFTMIDNLANSIEAGKTDEASSALDTIDAKVNDLLFARSTIGAKINRLELQKSRLESTQTEFTALLAQNEDADMAEVIINLKMQENVYRAALSAGAKIIQPSLVDFIG
ncbi:MAG: flagellar hook-associated protein FlgL [Syntrophomonadaceae bacterium]|jgi:flagellar hook-associated protein 3 FlgL